jgi:hypothetical protein
MSLVTEENRFPAVPRITEWLAGDLLDRAKLSCPSLLRPRVLEVRLEGFRDFDVVWWLLGCAGQNRDDY